VKIICHLVYLDCQSQKMFHIQMIAIEIKIDIKKRDKLSSYIVIFIKQIYRSTVHCPGFISMTCDTYLSEERLNWNSKSILNHLHMQHGSVLGMRSTKIVPFTTIVSAICRIKLHNA